MHDALPFLAFPFYFPRLLCLFFRCGYKLENIFSEPITQILGVPEGLDAAGEIFINQGSTINITCIGIAPSMAVSLELIFTFRPYSTQSAREVVDVLDAQQ